MNLLEHITIEPTSRCNVNCLGCTRDINQQSMSLETFRKIYEILKDNGNIKSMLFFWRGEPTLNPYLPEMIADVAKDGVYSYVSTNSTTLHREEYANRLLEHLDKIELCIDGYSQETIEKYRRGISYEAVLKTLKVVGSIKTNTLKEMRVLMFKWNDGKEEFYRNLARENNIDLISFAVPFIFLDDMAIKESTVDEYLSSKPFFRRYEKGDDNNYIPKISKVCRFNILRDPVIAADGTIFPCCYDRYGVSPIGNILTDNLEDLKIKMEKIQPLMSNRKLSICKKNCYQPSVQTDYREFVGAQSEVLQKLFISCLTRSKNIGTFLVRARRTGGVLKSMYKHKKVKLFHPAS